MTDDESRAIQARYARRDAQIDEQRYSLYGNAAARQAHAERLSAVIELWHAHGWRQLSDLRITEVGCGTGGNLLDLIRLGAQPANLTGMELLDHRAEAAHATLPSAVTVQAGDARRAALADASQQAVLAFTVFSSVLDPSARRELAQAMWRWTAPGGGVLIYDLSLDNPRNPDVRRCPVDEIKALLPAAHLVSRRITLAPPLARRLPASWIGLAAGMLRPLRTHHLTWAVKPR